MTSFQWFWWMKSCWMWADRRNSLKCNKRKWIPVHECCLIFFCWPNEVTFLIKFFYKDAHTTHADRNFCRWSSEKARPQKGVSYLTETALGNGLQQFIGSFGFMPSNDTGWLHRQGFPGYNDNNIYGFLKEDNFCLFVLQQSIVEENCPDLNILQLSCYHSFWQ